MEAVESINPQEIIKINKDIIKSRFEQSDTSRLSEYVTGLKIDDPKLIDKLEEDQKNIRDKYNLPKREDIFNNPDDYEKYLRKIAQENGVKVIGTKEYYAKYSEGFVKNSLLDESVYDNDNKIIAVDIDNSDENSYIKSLVNFEHETIHSLQDKYSPNMEIEKKEYEAYSAGLDLDQLRADKFKLKSVFSFQLISSVESWYEEKSKKEKVEIVPKWNNPKWFLENIDKIHDDEEVEKYKEKIKKELLQMYNDAKKTIFG